MGKTPKTETAARPGKTTRSGGKKRPKVRNLNAKTLARVAVKLGL